jgi:Uma2 family endonuclease
MSAAPLRRLTASEYLTLVDRDTHGRTELVDGVVVAMAPERVTHNQTKFRLAMALDRAIKGADLPCLAYPDGMSVRTGTHKVREPDASVQCGRQPPGNAVELDDPVIVFEVVSPSSETEDAVTKFAEYFSVPSVQHYVIVHPEARAVVHHQRAGMDVTTRVVQEGILRLDPPGFDLPLEPLFGEDARPAAERGAT